LPGREVTAAETGLAGQLVDAVSGTVAWSDYRDESAAELRALVEAKLQGQAPAGGNNAGPPAVAGGVAAERSGDPTARGDAAGRRGAGTAQADPKEGLMLPQILPMLAVPAAPFDASDYVSEVKWDEVRALAAVEGGGWRLWGRGRSDYTDRYPELAVLARLPAETLVDGELVVLHEGRADLARLL
jgi:hypothetical protein